MPQISVDMNLHENRKEMNTPMIVAVIPAYNPGPIVTSVVSEVSKKVNRVILIDDGSDAENKLYIEECKRFENVKSILFHSNQGKGYALIRGFEEALMLNPDYILTIDADGQHNPAEIKKFKMLVSGQRHSFDLAIGTRKKKSNMPFRSKLGNILMSKLVEIIFDKPFEDTQSGFRMLSSAFAGEVLQRIPPGGYETEMKILIYALEHNLRVIRLEIETIYFGKNAGSRFRAVRDSLLVMTAFAKYALNGFISFLVNYSSFVVLVYFLGINYVPANIAAKTFGSACTFLIWKHNDFKSESLSKAKKDKFFLKPLLSLGITSLLLYLLVEFAGLPPIIAKPTAEFIFILALLGIEKPIFKSSLFER
jgi:glycosyltransferase involved in cell wall biosynthesis